MGTKETNPFRLAKPFLWDGKFGTKPSGYQGNSPRYICWALETVRIRYSSRLINYNVHAAKGMVLGRMEGEDTIGLWLQHKTNIDPDFLTHENQQFFRHRWLDHLAEEWDKGVRT